MPCRLTETEWLSLWHSLNSRRVGAWTQSVHVRSCIVRNENANGRARSLTRGALSIARKAHNPPFGANSEHKRVMLHG